MNNQYNIPVLFVFFNRQDTAMQSFANIALVRPSKLYLASDGGRNTDEHNVVCSLREKILSCIDWECDIHTLFHDKNLGCGIGVYSAINWLFENEEYGIILEDDCVANRSFFFYCDELLHKYRNDQRIAVISGHLLCEKQNIDTSYCFSRYASCWGWATWKRAWNNMDINMDWRKTQESDNILQNMGLWSKELSRSRWQLKSIDNNEVSAWDWQWIFTLSSQNQLSIFPRMNLVTNIGDGEDATHSSYSSIYVPSYELENTLIHPLYVCPNNSFDNLYSKNKNSFRLRIGRLFLPNQKKVIKRIIYKLRGHK